MLLEGVKTSGNKDFVLLKDRAITVSISGDNTVIAELLSGTVTSGTSVTFTDTTKDFAVNALVGKLARIQIGDVEYLRPIISNTKDTVTIAVTIPAVAASVVYGEAAAAQLTVTVDTAGAAGNNYTLSVVMASGDNDNMSVELVGTVLTVYLGKTDGVIDPLKNLCSDVATQVSNVPGFTGESTGADMAIAAETVAPLAFTGGIDALVIPVGAEYQILDIATNAVSLSAGSQLVGKIVPAFPDGTEMFTRVMPGNVAIASRNFALVAATEIIWDGSKLTDNVVVPPGYGGPVLVTIINGDDQSQDLVVTIEHEVSDGVWLPYAGADGTALTWTVLKNGGKGVYGPIQGWPRFVGGRVVLTAANAPLDTKTTSIQVQEV